jgi:enolase
MDFGVRWTLIGHSERRVKYGDTDEVVAAKVEAAQKAGLKVVLCIGEVLEERESGKTDEVNKRQLACCLPKILNWNDIVIAYEPVWAIGTGKVATPEQAQETHAAIRKYLRSAVGDAIADRVRIQYGGSASPANCGDLIKQPDIDGFLVGGASLKPEFMDMLNTCAPSVSGSMHITQIRAREIFDSRGFPTVEVDLCTESTLFRAAVPSGASTGIYEALELRDQDKGRLMGKGVLKAVANVNDIIGPKLIGMDVTKQAEIDKLMVEEMDGTKNEWGWSKSKLGANAILAVSMAVCRAGAAASEMPLYQYIATIAGKPTDKFVMPCPSFNVINGGSHAGNRLACQEFMILPTGASSFKDAMCIGAEVYHNLKSCIKKKYGQDACNVGDEGGFAPTVQDNNEALDVLMEAITKSGHKDKVKIGTDVAASEFYDAKTKLYDLDFKNPNSSSDMKKTADQLMDVYQNWLSAYPFVSIEDPFDQDDWDAYKAMMIRMGKDVQIVGDDLLVTNPNRIKKALQVGACNALLLKVNQIGSISEAIEAALMSQRAGWGIMVSHRSGETEDCFIADLVVGLRTGQIKTGAPCRSERLSKYNQLIRIEEELAGDASFAGTSFRHP